MNFIKNIKPPKIAKLHPTAFSMAVLLHVILFISLFFFSVQRWDDLEEKSKKVAPKFIPKAVTVDLSEIKKEKQRLLNNQKKKIATLKREERRLRELEDKRYKKQRKINQLKAKVKKEKLATKLAENKRKKAEKKSNTAENKKKEIEKQLVVKAKKFKEEQKKYALTKQTQLEYEQKRKRVQKTVMDELKVNYINQIASRVRSQWRYQGGKDYWSCEVHILQDEGGNVKKVDLQSCNIDNKSKVKSFKNAIKRAVNKASPLPAAPDKSIFERKIIFYFRVN